MFASCAIVKDAVVKRMSAYIVLNTPVIATSFFTAKPASVVAVQPAFVVLVCPVIAVAVSIPVSILLRFVALTAGTDPFTHVVFVYVGTMSPPLYRVPADDLNGFEIRLVT